VPATLELDHVCKSYSGTVAVNDFSLSIAPGTIFGLLGPNGAGKTSAIRIMIGILLPDSGVVRIFGAPLARALTRRVGYLPEKRGRYRKMTVLENLTFIGELAGLSARDARARAGCWIKRLQLDGWLGRRVEELSRGMKQKIPFIAALIHDPELVVLDEPFSGLDPINANALKDIVIELRRRGRTILLSTHRMDQADKLCDQICLINRGRTVLNGDLRTIRGANGKRSIAIELEGGVDFLRASPLIEQFNDFGTFAELTLRPGADSQEILRTAMAYARVIRFEVREPSLEEIFISAVRESSG
jgi:ABC-2 type transport system ATP-binding protein